MFGRHKAKRADHTKPDLPITPMLDMSFQLMAFFILTFKPAPTEAQLPLALPPAAPSTESAPPPPLNDVEEEKEISAQVYAAGNGNVSKIIVSEEVGDTELPDTSALFKYLKGLAEQRKNKKAPKLKLEIAGDVNYQYVIKMIDEGRRAGIEQISPNLLGANTAKPGAKK